MGERGGEIHLLGATTGRKDLPGSVPSQYELRDSRTLGINLAGSSLVTRSANPTCRRYAVLEPPGKHIQEVLRIRTRVLGEVDHPDHRRMVVPSDGSLHRQPWWEICAVRGIGFLPCSVIPI